MEKLMNWIDTMRNPILHISIYWHIARILRMATADVVFILLALTAIGFAWELIRKELLDIEFSWKDIGYNTIGLALAFII